MATNSETVVVLNRLVRICNASERGFNLAAENVKNRGLSVIFKGYAQQRGQFAAQLRELIEEAGGLPAEGSGALAVLHRGWINIKAAMTIGQPQTERVVLAEVSRGEGAARETYRNALREPLPEELRRVVEAQYAAVEAVGDRVQKLCGEEGQRLVVRLFDSSADAAVAEDELALAGFPVEDVDRVQLNEAVLVYQGQGQDRTVFESAAAGATLGGLLGSFIGLVAGISALMGPVGPLADMTPLPAMVVTIIAGFAAGLFFGALFGAVIGVGVVQEDEFRYASSMKQGNLLLLVDADDARADEATNIMKGVNARRWQVAAGT
ncbi:MAG: PA2169 family four-helix-bundle protein [Anaerolineae bacterium]|nr:PA2169 family four-helix-bundle protein [Anaerolineae bacterium]